MGSDSKYDGSRKDRKKKDKKHKKGHKKKSRRHSSSSSSDSEGDDVNRQLREERGAIETLRNILSQFPNEKKKLREILWELDNGQQVDIAKSLPTSLVRDMSLLLASLKFKKSSKGSAVFRQSSHSSRALDVLGFVFDEAIRARPVVVAATRDAPNPKDQDQRQTNASTVSLSPPHNDLLPAHHAPVDTESEEEEEEEEEEEKLSGTGEQVPEPAGARVMRGPAMPPPELLAAAAAAEEAARLAEEEAAAARDEGLVLVELPPADMEEELSKVPESEREAQVLRVMRIVKTAEQQAASRRASRSSSAVPLEQQPDPYALLGVDTACSTADVKKAFMRLSLLIHPDKCQHPMAHSAFQAVGKASRALQDTEARAAIDAAREDAELRRMAEAAAAEEERARAWRIARGEEVAGPGPSASGSVREEWMTQLPPERRPPTVMSQESVRAFSRTGVTPRGDSSMWTDTPAQAAAREAQARLESLVAETVPRISMPEVPVASAQPTKKSLLEQHQEAQQEVKGSGKKRQRGGESADASGKSADVAGKAAADTGGLPWRPFDRVKDLEAPRNPKGTKDLLKGAGALNSRFGGQAFL